MTHEHRYDETFDKAREKLKTDIEEFIRTVDPENPMLMNASLVYETTTWDDECQVYRTEHVMFGSSGLAANVGLLEVAKHRTIKYMNRAYGHEPKED